MAVRKKHIEDCTQRFVVNYLRNNGIFVFAVPNGGSRKNALEGYNLKLSGVMAGVADLIILLPKRVVFVEMKMPEGRQSDSQKEFEKKVEELGFEYYIWRSVDEAVQFVKYNKNMLTY